MTQPSTFSNSPMSTVTTSWPRCASQVAVTAERHDVAASWAAVTESTKHVLISLVEYVLSMRRSRAVAPA